MYPIVFSSDANDFSTQGYGALSDCIMCEVTEELNGAYTLELTYPLNGLHSEYLTVGNIIVAKPNHNQMRQPFRISEVKKSFANNFQVYANHICYDLSGYPLRSAYSYSSLQDVLDAMNGFTWSTGTATYNQFEFGTDMASSKSFSMPAMQTMRSWMGGQEGSIIDVYGGEWIYNNFSCFLTSRRGRDTGIRISYGKNLAEYEKKRNYTEYSHVCAYWKKSDEVVYGDLTVTGVDCPFRCAYIDASNEFESQPTAAQLNTYANSQIAATNFSTQTITVSPAQIDNEVISLGDSVLICYDSVFSTRVVKTVWNALTETYVKLELGTKKQNIADTIKTLTTGPNGSSGGGSSMPALEKYTTTNNFCLWKIGKIVQLRCYGIRYPDLRAITVPVGYRPSYGLSFPAVILLNGKAYQCYVTISPAGVLQCQYYDYAGSPSTPVDACDIYCTCVYFLN